MTGSEVFFFFLKKAFHLLQRPGMVGSQFPSKHGSQNSARDALILSRGDHGVLSQGGVANEIEVRFHMCFGEKFDRTHRQKRKNQG